jgi:hypothetical protein
MRACVRVRVMFELKSAHSMLRCDLLKILKLKFLFMANQVHCRTYKSALQKIYFYCKSQGRKILRLLPIKPTVFFIIFLLTYVLSYLLTYLLSFFLPYLLSYLLTSLLSFLIIYLLNFFLTYLLTYLPTPRSRFPLEKLTGVQLVKKFPAFY